MNRIPPKELIELAKQLTLHEVNLSVVPDNDDFPWFIREFQKLLIEQQARHELLLPNIRDNNESIAVFSDYGGESSDSKYLTYSFLICAWNQTGPFNKAMEALRNNSGLNDPFKEIAFKDLRYGPIRRSLKQYLANLSNLVNGYLLTVVIEKSVGTIFGNDRKDTHEFLKRTLGENGFGTWKPDIAEKIFRITHFAAYLVALLSKKGQKVLWMTDHDSIAPNHERFMDVLNLFNQFLNHYCNHELSTIGGALPFKERSADFLDLLSAKDMVAGSVEHYFSHVQEGTAVPFIKDDVNNVLRWLSGQGVSLKRNSMIIRKKEGNFLCSGLNFIIDDPDPETLFIPISVK